MLQTIHEGYDNEPFNGIILKYGNIVRQSCLARNSSVSCGGVTLTQLELAFGRRLRDIVTPANSEPSEPNQLAILQTQKVTATAIRELANKAYQEDRQSDDLRRDLAARLDWSVHTSKLGSTGCRQGRWVKERLFQSLVVPW